MSDTTIYVASAGTGKTTALMEELDQALQESSPDKIIFTTFTNAGANEAKARAMLKFPSYREDQFRYFRTLHSLGYRNIVRRKLLGFADYIDLGRQLGYPINAARALSTTDGQESNQMTKGDHLLHLDSLKRNCLISYEEVATRQELSNFSPNEIKNFSEAYALYKQRTGKYDFTDQLEKYLDGLDGWDADITHLFVDEAQDLSGLQWAIVRKLSERVHARRGRCVIAGDDKQAIYKFSGGDPMSLIQYEGTRKILGESYRLPPRILEYAETIAERIQEKQAYTVTPAASIQGVEGAVETINNVSDLDVSKGSWLFLVRNRKFLPYFEHVLDVAGYNYESMSPESAQRFETMRLIRVWKEMLLGYSVSAGDMQKIYREYLRGKGSVKHGFKKMLYVLDEHESLTRDELMNEYGLVNINSWSEAFVLPDKTKQLILNLEKNDALEEKPRIRVSTIHAVKGMEADNVVLLPDLSVLTDKEYHKDPDSENRVFYVGVTRAKKALYLHKPITDRHYRLP